MARHRQAGMPRDGIRQAVADLLNFGLAPCNIEQRPGAVRLHELQEAKLDQMLVEWHPAERAALDGVSGRDAPLFEEAIAKVTTLPPATQEKIGRS
jgi:hypothetical protein